MITFACRGCGTELEVSASKAGAKVVCPECNQRCIVPTPAAPKQKSDTRLQQSHPKSAPPDKAGKKPPGQRREADEDDESRSARPGKAAKKPQRPARRDSSRRREGNNKVLIAWIGGGTAAAVCLVVVLIIVLARGWGKKDTPAVAQDNEPRPRPSPVVTPEPPAPKPKPADNAEPFAFGGNNPASGADVYQHVLKSTVWIVVPVAEGLITGTGTLIDHTNKWVLTNYHVVAPSNGTVVVFFPSFKDGKPLAERDAYLELQKTRKDQLISGRVLMKSEEKDLALVQLTDVSSDAVALPVAGQSVTTGETVHSVGNPGASGALWVYTSGTVRSVYHKRWQSSGGEGEHVMNCDAQVVETQSPTNPGDSGGPLVNGQGEMVGVTHGGSATAHSLSLFIDVTEVRKFVGDCAQRNQIAWVEDHRRLAGHGTADVADLVKALENPEAKIRAKAAAALGAKGPDAKLALRSLVKVVKTDTDDLARRQALEALDKIGRPDNADLSFLRDYLRDQNTDLRGFAASALGKLGPDARGAAPDILPLMADRAASVRQQAARTLGKVGADSKEKVFDALREALKDSDRDVRLAAAEAICTIEDLSVSDVPLLVQILKHQDQQARTFAARGLARLGRGAKAALPDLMAAYAGADQSLRRAVIETVAQLGVDAKPAVPTFAEALQDSDASVRKQAILALAKLGPDAKEAARPLGQVLSDSDKDVRQSAVVALRKIGPGAKEAVPALAQLLSEEIDTAHGQALRLEVLSTLGAIGPQAKAAVPDLLRSLHDNRLKEIHNPTAFTLAKIGKVAIKDLAAALKNDDNWCVRAGAAIALGEIGKPARLAAARLLALHAEQDENKIVRDACASAYGKVMAR
ncbi:MAG TPA: HEAT repeat domain-containing protein [Gemmataceae bacterium]|nr:HEAT repeat domain-containing protein [Gemmataceae bacterium]